MKKLFLLTGCLFLFWGLSETTFAQSKTEDAKERLKGNKSSTAETFIDFLFISIEFLPYFFYFTPDDISDASLRYNSNPYPSYSSGGFGIRDYSGNGNLGMIETQLMLDMPLTSKAMEMRNADMRWHVGFWGFRGGYSYMKESIAPYGIHQYHLDVERKFRLLPQTDGGFFMGYRSFGLSSDRFDGFDLGIDITAYAFNPVSFQYIYNATILRYGEAHQHQIMAHVHQGQFRFTTGYRHLSLLGVPFSAMVAGVGFNF